MDSPEFSFNSAGGQAKENIGFTALYGDMYGNSIDNSPSYDLLQELRDEHPDLQIREEQIDCLDAIHLARLRGQRRALVQMATGLGKTTVVATDVKRFLKDSPNSRVLFLCHQNRILEQARERFETLVGPDYTYGNFSGEGEKDYHEVTCLFASFQVMSDWREAFKSDEFDYVIVDESRHVMAPTYRPTIEHFRPQFLLGVTGTPDRHDLQDIRQVFGPEIYQKPLEEAIAEGLLTQTEYSVIIDEVEAKRRLKDDRGFRYNIKDLNRSIFVPMRDEEMARICKEKADELGVPVRRIVFCPSIEHTEEFAGFFEKAAPMHSDLPTWEKKQTLDKFRKGDIQTLLTIDMFNEGIDVPEINQVVFLRVTQSKTIFLQQLGRGLRKSAGKDKVQVLDFVANADKLTMLDRFYKRIKQYTPGHPVRPDIFTINIGDTNFSETVRDVLEVISDIETRHRLVRNWSADDSIAYYNKVRSEIGRHPRRIDLIEYSKSGKGPSDAVVLDPFEDKISALRKAAGYASFYEWTAEDSIAYYIKLKEELGRHPTAADLQNLSRDRLAPSFDIVVRPFGRKISGLREAAGFHRPVDWTPEKSVNHYTDLCQRLGRLARIADVQEEYERDKGPHVQLLLRDFGSSIIELRKACDLPQTIFEEGFQGFDTAKRQNRKQTRYTNANLIDRLMELEHKLGREPKIEDVEQSSRSGGEIPSASTYTRYFGRWREVRKLLQEARDSRATKQVIVSNNTYTEL